VVDAGIIVLLALIVCAWFERWATAAVVLLQHPRSRQCPVTSSFSGMGSYWPSLSGPAVTCLQNPSSSSCPLYPAWNSPRSSPLLVPFPISVTRHFIPLSALEDVVIHEGLRRWNVRYYLAALQRYKRSIASALAAVAVSDEYEAGTSASGSGDEKTEPGSDCSPLTSPSEASGDIEVHVAFTNVLPYFPALHAVYCEVQKTLFLLLCASWRRRRRTHSM